MNKLWILLVFCLIGCGTAPSSSSNCLVISTASDQLQCRLGSSDLLLSGIPCSINNANNQLIFTCQSNGTGAYNYPYNKQVSLDKPCKNSNLAVFTLEQKAYTMVSSRGSNYLISLEIGQTYSPSDDKSCQFTINSLGRAI